MPITLEPLVTVAVVPITMFAAMPAAVMVMVVVVIMIPAAATMEIAVFMATAAARAAVMILCDRRHAKGQGNRENSCKQKFYHVTRPFCRPI
jgi:hypothetical protein